MSWQALDSRPRWSAGAGSCFHGRAPTFAAFASAQLALLCGGISAKARKLVKPFEPRDQWGNPGSKTGALMRQIAGALVERYRNSKGALGLGVWQRSQPAVEPKGLARTAVRSSAASVHYMESGADSRQARRTSLLDPADPIAAARWQRRPGWRRRFARSRPRRTAGAIRYALSH